VAHTLHRRTRARSHTRRSFKGFNDITTADLSTESFYHPDSTLQSNKVKALSRTFAPVIAGQPSAMSFDPASAAFSLLYTTLSIAATVTQLYLPLAFHYPNGYDILVVPAAAVSSVSPPDAHGIVSLTVRAPLTRQHTRTQTHTHTHMDTTTPHASGLAVGSKITVTVTAKSA
jgi:hypothetical protein